MSKPDDTAKLVLEVLVPFVHKLRQEFRLAIGGDLTTAQFRILANVSRGNDTASGIAKEYGVSQAAISKMISALMSRGFLRRARPGPDRRHRRLALTLKGRAYYLDTRRQVRANLSRRIGRMSPRVQRDLWHGITAIAETFLQSGALEEGT